MTCLVGHAIDSYPTRPTGLPPKQGTTEPGYLYPRDAYCASLKFFGPHLANRAPDPPEPSGVPRHRVRVFVDFWNYTLSMQSRDREFWTDWSKFGPVLSRAAADVVAATAVAEYQGVNIYGSYDPNSEKDRRMHQWATRKLDTFAGVSVSMVPRHKKKKAPKCPVCHEVVASCPVCKADMRGTEEKGVDVRMATAMISLAWIDNYDIAVLVSSDRDFVPVAEFLETRGIKVIHGKFPPLGAELTARCWGSIDVASQRESFRLDRPRW